MLYISYDIADDRLRGKFSKFLKKYGRRVQFSVYEIKNSDRHTSTILTEIDARFMPRFSQSDSVIIVPISRADESKIIRYGYSASEEEEFLWVE